MTVVHDESKRLTEKMFFPIQENTNFRLTDNSRSDQSYVRSVINMMTNITLLN